MMDVTISEMCLASTDSEHGATSFIVKTVQSHKLASINL